MLVHFIRIADKCIDYTLVLSIFSTQHGTGSTELGKCLYMHKKCNLLGLLQASLLLCAVCHIYEVKDKKCLKQVSVHHSMKMHIVWSRHGQRTGNLTHRTPAGAELHMSGRSTNESYGQGRLYTYPVLRLTTV